MKFSTLTAMAALCAAIGMTVPALALDLSAGVSIGASASASSDSDSGSSSLNVGLGAGVDASTDDGDDDGDGSGASASAGGDGSASVSVDSNSDASASADLALRLIALIESSTWNEGSLNAVADVSTAATFDIDEVIDAESRVAIDAAIDANIGDVEDLRTAVAANAEFSAWLQSQNADAGSVVAIGATGDGSLAVFTD